MTAPRSMVLTALALTVGCTGVGTLADVVYRDGQRLPVSPRGGSFYVDVAVSGSHAWAVTAPALAGVESLLSASVATAQAKDGWWRAISFQSGRYA